MTPPRLPRLILHALVPFEDRAAVIGDLDEEFGARAGADASAAARWYWRQALGSIPGALKLRWRRAAILGDVAGDLRRAMRLFRREPGFAAAAVATIALGSGITTGVVSIVEAILVRPLPYGNADRVMSIHERDRNRQGGQLSWADFQELSAALPAFSAMAGYTGASRTLTGMGAAERVNAIEVTPTFFAVIGVAPARGRRFIDGDAVAGAQPVVMLSDRAWRRRFGAEPSAVGRSISLSGVSTVVIGVLPAGFVFPLRADPELWLPLRPSAPQMARPYLHFMDAIAVPRADVTVAAATDALHEYSQQWNTSGATWHRSTTLVGAALREDMVSAVRPALYVILGAAVLVLLASSVNVSALLLARATGRARELGVRTALGASRWRIVRQLGIESACIALAGSMVGLALGAWGVQVFSSTTPARFRAVLPFADSLGVSPIAATFSVLVTVGAVLLAGLAPALRMVRPINPLLTGTRMTGGRHESRLRGVLVASQVALAVILLAGTALVGRSVMNLSRVSPGFDVTGLVAGRVNFPQGRYETRPKMIEANARILDLVRAIPGVTGAEAINQLPLTGRSNTGDFAIVGRADKPSLDSLIRDVTPGYFALMGIPLLQGRHFESTDTATTQRVVVVNRTLARACFGERGAIGQRIVFEFFDGKPEWTIVGVVGDEQFDALDKPMPPVVYFPFAQDPGGSFYIVTRATTGEAVLPSIRAAIASFDPSLPLYGVQTLARTASDSNAMFLRSLVTRLLAWFALAALALAGIGIYGVLAEAISARTKEIGVRLALGASPGGIARLILRTGAAPALAGLIAGVALTLLASPAVRSLLFGVRPLDPLSFAAVVVLLAAVTLVACAVPAWRAIQLPVMKALRSE
jgi:putative ABC transport system permease protein